MDDELTRIKAKSGLAGQLTKPKGDLGHPLHLIEEEPLYVITEEGGPDGVALEERDDTSAVRNHKLKNASHLRRSSSCEHNSTTRAVT